MRTRAKARAATIEPLASPPTSTPWVPMWPLNPPVLNPGAELAYTQITAPVTITASVEASPQDVVSAPALTLDGATPIVIEFFSPSVTTAPTGGALVIFELWDGGTYLARLADLRTPAAKETIAPVGGAIRLTPAAGSHTYRIRAFVGGGNGVVGAGLGTGGATAQVPAFIRITQVGTTPGSRGTVTYGTSLPTTPLDGQEHVLVDSLTNPSYQWRFRYNAGSSSPYKWEFIGGSPLSNWFAGPGSIGTNGIWGGFGWSIAAPRAGDYQVAYAAQLMAGGGANVAMYVGVGVGTTPADESCSAFLPAGEYMTMGREAKLLGVPAGAAINVLGHQTAGGGSNVWSGASLIVTPARVS